MYFQGFNLEFRDEIAENDFRNDIIEKARPFAHNTTRFLMYLHGYLSLQTMIQIWCGIDDKLMEDMFPIVFVSTFVFIFAAMLVKSSLWTSFHLHIIYMLPIPSVFNICVLFRDSDRNFNVVLVGSIFVAIMRLFLFTVTIKDWILFSKYALIDVFFLGYNAFVSCDPSFESRFYVLLIGGLYTCVCLYNAYYLELITRTVWYSGKRLNAVLDDESDKRKKSEQMVQFLSHEIRNPENVISLALESLLKETTLNANKFSQNHINAFRYMHQASRQVTQLLENVLLFRRLSEHKVYLESQPINLVDIFNSVAQNLKDCKGVIVCSNQTKVTPMRGDIYRLEQLISHLISFEVSCTSCLEINISSSIVGLEDNRFLFQLTIAPTNPNVSSSKSFLDASFGSSISRDLELDICKGLVSLFNGTLEFDSTHVVVSLPLDSKLGLNIMPEVIKENVSDYDVVGFAKFRSEIIELEYNKQTSLNSKVILSETYFSFFKICLILSTIFLLGLIGGIPFFSHLKSCFAYCIICYLLSVYFSSSFSDAWHVYLTIFVISGLLANFGPSYKYSLLFGFMVEKSLRATVSIFGVRRFKMAVFFEYLGTTTTSLSLYFGITNINVPFVLTGFLVIPPLMSFLLYKIEVTDRVRWSSERQLNEKIESDQYNRSITERMILYLSSEVQVPQNSILAIVDSLVDECKEPITESSDMLLKNSDFGADHLELFEVIQQSCEFVSSLLKDVLNYQTLHDGKVMLTMEKFSPKLFLKSLKRTIVVMLSKIKIGIFFNVDPSIPSWVIGDKYRIQQVILNFVSNAAKFTPEGGSVVIDIVASDIKSNLCTIRFSVKDTGPGISFEDKQKLFQSFSQINPLKMQGGKGMGLGLFICKNLIEMHSGRIGVNSEVGNGAGLILIYIFLDVEFYFEIPFEVVEETGNNFDMSPNISLNLTQSESPTRFSDKSNSPGRFTTLASLFSAAKSSPMNINQSPYLSDEHSESGSDVHIVNENGNLRRKYCMSTPNKIKPFSENMTLVADLASISNVGIKNDFSFEKTVLVAEDNNFVRILMSRTLKQLNFHSECVEDGQKAVDYVIKHAEDIKLCIFDLIMPNLGGVEALIQIRKKGILIPTIGLTGEDTEESRIKFVNAGATCVLLKPVRMDDLSRAIEAALNKKEI